MKVDLKDIIRNEYVHGYINELGKVEANSWHQDMFCYQSNLAMILSFPPPYEIFQLNSYLNSESLSINCIW